MIESQKDFNKVLPIYSTNGIHLSDGWTNSYFEVKYSKTRGDSHYFHCEYKDGRRFEHHISRISLNKDVKLCYKHKVEPYDPNQEPEDDCLKLLEWF